ncbi:MAG: hypothetical protein J6B04_06300 [Clostridia bacterium]|nr:hypothetical protein [Clostridia bacterium]
MKKNKIISSIIVTALAASVVLPGCGLVSTNSEKDMAQVVATVDITASETLSSELKAYESAIEPTNIYKRDLISYFYNVGSSYIQNGYTYSQVFEMLVEGLVNSALITQYSTLYVLNELNVDKAAYAAVTGETEIDKQIAQYETYLLTAEEVKEVKYSYWSSLNSSINSYEQNFIDEEDEEKRGSATRTTPTNVDTEVEDFYPETDSGELNYNIYTGYEGYKLSQSGDYQENGALDGTTKTTRLRAYNAFVNSLKSNYLIKEGEDISEILKLDYIKTEYLAELKSAIVNKFYEIREEKLETEILSDENEEAKSYIQNRYEELVNQQKANYTTSTAFETAMGSMSDSSFILYSPDTTKDTKDANGTFGFVYNILLPFSSEQSYQLSALQAARDGSTAGKARENTYFASRNAILKQIETEDQRAAWFNGATEYAFDATDKVSDYFGDSKYLFFENNVVANDRYEGLKNYIGKYAYNGKVIKNNDETYTLKGEKLDIDGMLSELEAYVNYVLGSDKVDYTVDNGYYTRNDFYTVDEEGKDVVDYSKLVYASGKINVGTLTAETRKNVFVDGDLYKAMSAVNELQYAYTTDTAVLSEYLGYTISAYSTQFIKEFEYAAQTAVKEGAGTFKVCAGDYGWHLIYVTYTFDPNGGNVYGAPDWSKIEDEGTFEKLFFDYVMQSDLSNATTGYRVSIVEEHSSSNTVSLFEDTYQDLMELDNQTA